MNRIQELIAKGLNTLTAEELEELHGLLDDEAARVSADDIEVTDEVIEEMKYIRDSIVAVKGEETARAEAEAERKRIADELRKEIAGTDPEDPEGDPEADPEGEPEPATEPAEGKEPIAAAAPAPARPAPGAVRRRTPRPTDQPAAERRPALVAAANLSTVQAGADVSELPRFADAFHESYLSNIGYMGPRQKFTVVRGQYQFAEDRILDDNVEENERKINDFVRSYASRQAVTAAGGICAPAPIQYDLPTIGSVARPIRDALPNFGATRGAIRTIVPPTISDVSGGFTLWTQANDVSPSSPTTKGCLTVTCGTDTTTNVDALVECLRAGNFMDRYFRERIDAFQRLLMVYAARQAEQALIAKIAAGSTTVTAGVASGGFGTTRDVLATLDRHLAAVRYWYRLDDGDRFRLLVPEWLRDNMQTDLARELPGATAERLAMADAEINQFFNVRGVNVTYIMEGESTQRFNAPVAGGVQPWPSHVLMYLFPEGSWTYLNGGRLDLGQVRDSTLNGVNDFQMFAETFEQVHFHGTFSHKIDVDICPSGVTQAAAAINVCASGS